MGWLESTDEAIYQTTACGLQKRAHEARVSYESLLRQLAPNLLTVVPSIAEVHRLGSFWGRHLRRLRSQGLGFIPQDKPRVKP